MQAPRVPLDTPRVDADFGQWIHSRQYTFRLSQDAHFVDILETIRDSSLQFTFYLSCHTFHQSSSVAQAYLATLDFRRKSNFFPSIFLLARPPHLCD
jgi:hypothetical protein